MEQKLFQERFFRADQLSSPWWWGVLGLSSVSLLPQTSRQACPPRSAKASSPRWLRFGIGCGLLGCLEIACEHISSCLYASSLITQTEQMRRILRSNFGEGVDQLLRDARLDRRKVGRHQELQAGLHHGIAHSSLKLNGVANLLGAHPRKSPGCEMWRANQEIQQENAQSCHK